MTDRISGRRQPADYALLLRSNENSYLGLRGMRIELSPSVIGVQLKPLQAELGGWLSNDDFPLSHSKSCS